MSGDAFADRYELRDRLGSGGMSTVHLAFDRRLERHVAIKLLAEHLAHDEQFVSRFKREALAAARLVHPNIVQVFDSGFDDTSGRHFIVMEYVKGHSCAEMLRDHGRLGVEEVLHLGAGACAALDHAHRHGVIHRDVKPGNLLRTEDGIVKLADFGIAKAIDSVQITQVGSVLGTAAYLAPEQAHGDAATPQSDLYGLGVVLYQLLAGRLPYEATTLPELVDLQQAAAPTRLDVMDPNIPTAVADAVQWALSMASIDRPASAADLASTLRGASRPPEPATSATRVVPAGPVRTQRRLQAEPPAMALPTAQPVDQPAAQASGGRRAVRAFFATLALVAVIGGAAWVGLMQTQEAVTTREVVGDSTGEIVDQMRRLIDDNVR